MEKVKKITNKTFSSLKIRNYRLYFFGQAVSQIGTWMQTIALSWLVLKLTDSGTQLGLVAAAQFLPVLIFGPIAGLIADKFYKRKLILFCQISFGLLAFILAVLVSTGAIKLWMIYLIATGNGLLSAMDTPSRHVFVYEMVGSNNITNAISLNNTLYNICRIIGPAIAAIFIVSFGMSACFYLNAISYSGLIVGLLLMDTSKLTVTPRLEKIKGQLTEGFKYVLSQPLLRDVLIFMTLIGIFIYEFTISVPLLAKTTFNAGAPGFAALTSAMGIGAVFGGLFSASGNKPTMSHTLMAILFLSLGMILAGLSPNFITALIAMFIIGFSGTSFTARGNVLLQLNSAPDMRGRVLALWNVGINGTTPIGGPIIGYVSEHFSPRSGFVLGGIAGLVALMYGHISQKQNSSKI